MRGRTARGLAVLLAGLFAVLAAVCPAEAQVDLPRGTIDQPIAVTADWGSRWTEGSYEVWTLQGNCRLQQGQDTATAREAVLWIERNSPQENGRTLVIAYLEGKAKVLLHRQGGRAELNDDVWLGRFRTGLAVDVRPVQTAPPPEVRPVVYDRGMAQRSLEAGREVRQAQAVESIPSPAPLVLPEAAAPPSTRRFRVLPRGETRSLARVFQENNQTVIVVEGGVNMIIEGLALPQAALLGPPQAASSGVIDIVADRAVIWTVGLDQIGDLRNPQAQSQDVPLEVYLEGNIVFRQGEQFREAERVIYADRMYYDVANRVGTVLGAEMLTPVPSYDGLLRLRAEVLQQRGEGRFFAQNAWITSSRLGSPRYRLQSSTVTYEENRQQRVDPVTGLPLVDPMTGQPLVEEERFITAQNNALFVGDLPVFWWPYMATDATEPTLYIRRARLRQDSIFGTQALTDWNLYQLLGIRNRPDGTDWTLSLDYLSERGFGHGTTFNYVRPEGILDVTGSAAGVIDYWGIYDNGLDVLGRDRMNIPPEEDYRFRLFAQHRQMLAGGWEALAEVGWISDRNFLEQYFEREWDELKDMTTGLQLRRIDGNRSMVALANVQVNDFFTTTEWLPRLDHFWLGQSFGNDVFTWYEHSSVGYAQFNAGDRPPPPQDPGNKFRYLPWETVPGTDIGLDLDGERLITRQEIDYPFQLGPLKLVPYALGELGHWGEDRTGNDIQRAYGQTGVRASLPMWSVNPNVESVLWNVHGLAHKIEFEGEFFYADASEDLDQYPLYDPLDDDSIEQFRKRFVPNTFAAPPGSISPFPAIPLRFDERYYAVRTNMQSWVTAPSMEIAEDLLGFRLGMKNRWQTKRGVPGRQRIIDWITLDMNLTLFPDEERFFPTDVTPESAGLFDYDARWQVGDRLALLSSGLFDLFSGGLSMVNIGAFLDRPPKGGLYLGVRLLDGPIENTVLAASYTYRMSPKWVSAAGFSYDLTNDGNIGQNFSVTRIGESFLVSAGFTYDASRENWGVGFSIEPRFLPRMRVGSVGHGPIAPTQGLE